MVDLWAAERAGGASSVIRVFAARSQGEAAHNKMLILEQSTNDLRNMLQVNTEEKANLMESLNEALAKVGGGGGLL